MSHSQGGLLVAVAFPDHCDGLALLNALDTVTNGGKLPPAAQRAQS